MIIKSTLRFRRWEPADAPSKALGSVRSGERPTRTVVGSPRLFIIRKPCEKKQVFRPSVIASIFG
jgi:hypothetical protein